MKFRFIILISVLLFITCNKEIKSKTLSVSSKKAKLLVSNLDKELHLKKGVLFYKKSKFDGVVYKLYKSKDTLSIVNFYNGLQDGISKKWYLNKKLMELRNYKKGQKNGKQIAYFDNGKKKFLFIAKNDVYEGELKEWNNKGDLIHLATYKNGQEEGTQKMWYDNGKIRANYIMKNGKRYGLLGTKNCTNVSDSIFLNK